MAAPSINSFLWHDYETFGADARRDRPAQFAAIRTDDNLSEIGAPFIIYCRPADDMLPHPDACMLTGITPQIAMKEGVPESEFAMRIRMEMLQAGTCVAGYNSIRFDDEFTRNMLYRNLYDPYEREWASGNSRWDIIDLARACYALRPEGVIWPRHENGNPSFKLEHLSAANNIEHGDAHDALSDVRATIGLAAALKTAQPRLFQYGLSLRDKDAVANILDPLRATPFVHTTSRIPAERGCTSVMLALARHPSNPKAVLCADLNHNIDDLIKLGPDEISDRLFTPKADLPEGVERIQVKSIASNKIPFVAPLNVLKGIDLERIALDLPRCLENAERLTSHGKIGEKLTGLFGPYDDSGNEDPDLMLYSGNFFSGADKRLMTEVHATRPENLTQESFPFSDDRLEEMLFRYRARNFPDLLNAAEEDRWRTYKKQKLLDESDHAGLSYSSYQTLLTHWNSQENLTRDQQDVLRQLSAWPAEIGIPGMISNT